MEHTNYAEAREVEASIPYPFCGSLATRKVDLNHRSPTYEAGEDDRTPLFRECCKRDQSDETDKLLYQLSYTPS